MSTLPEQKSQTARVSRRKKALLTIYEIAVFGMLGALMMVSDLLMNIIPNVHLVGVTIVVLTVLYRWKALFPIYVYVLLIGLSEGMGAWWLPYLYVWTILWGMVRLLPKKCPSGSPPSSTLWSADSTASASAFGGSPPRWLSWDFPLSRP